MKPTRRDAAIALLFIIIASAILIAFSFIPIKITTQDKCTYDRSIELQKARFDFANALNGYPYDKLKFDFVYALQYARCS